MSTLTVGSGQTYSSIAAAVGAAQSGDIINVQAGTYTNDFINVNKSLSFNAVGGMVTMAATVSPPNGKAIVDEGGSNVSVSFNGFAFTGASVGDANGAGIRYEGGSLTITNSHFYGNQEGLLANSDPNGTISISNSEFDHNGAGDGYSHNIYIGDIAQFTLTNSYIHDANVGHEVKSRAENNVITNNRIFDNASTSSYEIDLPNGGNATIAGNVIEQGPNSGNPTIIAYGEEGNLHAGTKLSVTGNTIVNDKSGGLALWNAGSTAANFAGNSMYGFGAAALVLGSSAQAGTTVLAARPSLDQSAPYTVPAAVSTPATVPATGPVTAPTTVPATVPATSAGLVLSLTEDAWQGDAQYIVSIDGVQSGAVGTVTASHGAGASQQVTIGVLPAGQHSVGVTFLNDAWGGTAATDRNLYVNGATYNGVAVSGAAATLMSNGTSTFSVAPVSATVPVTVPVTVPATVPATSAGLVLSLSEDAWQGDAQFIVSIDGVQSGAVGTVTASHGAGASQQVTIGALPAGQHSVGVTFLNDAWGGTAATDRNLYVNGATYNGVAVSGAAATLMSNGASTFSVAGTASATSVPATTPTPATVTTGLIVNVAEDAWQGDAQFTILVDGKQVGGTYTATASEPAGQSQAISVATTLGSGAHTLGISFLNDAWGGTASTDRNLYVTGASYNGQSIPGSTFEEASTGTATIGFAAGSAATSTATLMVSEDAWQGDAQFTVSVDGKQMGGTYTATASHAAGQTQAINIAGIAEAFTPHDIAVTFLNDLYGGTPATDRNLYVNSVQFDGQAVSGGALILDAAGTQHVTALAPAGWTG